MLNILRIFRKNTLPAVILTPKLFKKCNELPIHNFNEVMNNQDLNYLKKNLDDDVPHSLLESTWLDIMDEYFTLTNNPKALYQMKNKIAIIILEKKIQLFEVFNFCLFRKVNIDAELKEYQITKENLSQHLGLLKNDLLKKAAALPEEIKTNNNEFDRTIAVLLSKGFAVNRFKTVVSEWVAMLEIIEKQNKAQQN